MAKVTILPGIVQQFDIPEAIDVSGFATSEDLSTLQQTVADNRMFQIQDDETIERQITQLSARIDSVGGGLTKDEVKALEFSDPSGGESFTLLQLAEGIARLNNRVIFLEQQVTELNQKLNG